MKTKSDTAILGASDLAGPLVWHKETLQVLTRKLGTDLRLGLSSGEAHRRLATYGENRLPEENADSYMSIIIRQIRSPLVYILLFAAFLSLSLQHYTDLAIIMVVVVVNVQVGFIQEHRASSTLQELKKYIRPAARAVRDGRLQEIPAALLVPGDMLEVTAGDRIPADCRVVEASGLEVIEASLSGESVPSLKRPSELDAATALVDRENMLYMGTEVASGQGRAVIVGTNLRTELGKIAELTTSTGKEMTPLQQNLAQFSRWIAWVTLAMGFFVLLLGIAQGQDFFDMLVTSVAVAVAAIPEGLLISLTIILAIGMQRILRKRGLVRHLSAAETLGSTSVICTDKTGTLTLGEMRVVSLVSPSAQLHHGEHRKQPRTHQLLAILRDALYSNTGIIENPESQPQNWKIVGNLTSKALLIAAGEVGWDVDKHRSQHKEIFSLPFSEKYKLAASLRRISMSRVEAWTTGAAEIVLARCTSAQGVEGGEGLRLLEERTSEMTGQGLRVLAVAYRKIDDLKESYMNGDILLRGMTCVGLIGLQDPLREDAAETIRQAQLAGIRPVMVTGDHKNTALSIARQLGLAANGDEAIEGSELDSMDDFRLYNRVAQIKVFARVTPEHKLRIIDAWQKRGEVVAMTGDGVNDAPALKKADIGMSLGSGTEVARSASDLVLLDNNFQTIVSAVEQGRIIYSNIRKVILYLLSDSFSQIVLLAGALMLGLPVPLLPAQILWSNLITDGFPNLALTYEPGDAEVMTEKPRKRSEPLINRRMKILIIFVGIVTDLIFLGFFMRLSGMYDLSTVRSIVFAATGFNSLLYVFSLKSLQKPLWRIPLLNNMRLIYAVMLGVSLQLAAIYAHPLQLLLHTVPLPWGLWSWVAGLSAIKLVAIETAKYFFRFSRVD